MLDDPIRKRLLKTDIMPDLLGFDPRSLRAGGGFDRGDVQRSGEGADRQKDKDRREERRGVSHG